MNRFFLSTVILFFFSTNLAAQNLSLTWGKLSQLEFDLNSYEPAPDVEALVLFDLGETSFIQKESAFQVQHSRTKRVKVLRTAGLKYGEISLPYHKKRGNIVGIEAVSYNLEGGEVVKSELSPDQIFEVEMSENVRVKKIVIPNVKVGSIIEYKYKLLTSGVYELPSWRFQSKIPTLYSKIVMRVVPFYEYSFITQGIQSFDRRDVGVGNKERILGDIEYKDLIYTFQKLNVPAFKDEAYISSVDDYIMKIDFQLSKINPTKGPSEELLTTWPKLIQLLISNKSFGKYCYLSETYSDRILKEELDLQNLTKKQKAEAIIRFVRTNFQWNRGKLGIYATQKPKEFYKTRAGNVAEINLFLVALLRRAGLEAYPVISSTRNNGRIKADYPFVRFFNYCLVWVKVENGSFLTDGTENQLAYNQLPIHSINHLGLVINKENKPTWLNLETSGTSLNRKVIRTFIDAESRIATTAMSIQSTDYEAYRFRKKFRNDNDLLVEEFEKYGFGEIKDLKTGNFDKPQSPYIIQIEGETELGSLGKGLILVQPFLGFAPTTYELTQEERNYPVDFIYAKEEEFVVNLNIPENFELEGLPEELFVENDLVHVSMKYTGGKEFLDIHAKYHLKKAIYDPADYVKLKEYIDLITQSFNIQLVLKRVGQ